MSIKAGYIISAILGAISVATFVVAPIFFYPNFTYMTWIYIIGVGSMGSGMLLALYTGFQEGKELYEIKNNRLHTQVEKSAEMLNAERLDYEHLYGERRSK